MTYGRVNAEAATASVVTKPLSLAKGGPRCGTASRQVDSVEPGGPDRRVGFRGFCYSPILPSSTKSAAPSVHRTCSPRRGDCRSGGSQPSPGLGLPTTAGDQNVLGAIGERDHHALGHGVVEKDGGETQSDWIVVDTSTSRDRIDPDHGSWHARGRRAILWLWRA